MRSMRLPCFYSFAISRVSYPAVLEDATLRDLDFVIPLIAVGDVIVESFAVRPAG